MLETKLKYYIQYDSIYMKFRKGKVTLTESQSVVAKAQEGIKYKEKQNDL